MPPMIAWSGTYRPITSDSQNRSRRSRRIRTTKRNIVIATITRTKVSRRLPNSMTPWIPISGVGTRDSAVQRGHVGHPSPDPVSLTSPPVPTIATWTASVAQAAAMTRRSTRAGSHAQNVRKMPRRVVRQRAGGLGRSPGGIASASRGSGAEPQRDLRRRAGGLGRSARRIGGARVRGHRASLLGMRSGRGRGRALPPGAGAEPCRIEGSDAGASRSASLTSVGAQVGAT